MQNQPTSLTPMVVLSTHRQECLLKPDGVSSGRPRIIKKRGGLLEELCHIALCVRPGSANARTDVSDSTSNCNRLPDPLENNACSRLTCGSVTCDTLGIAHRGAVDQIRFKILWINEVSKMCSKNLIGSERRLAKAALPRIMQPSRSTSAIGAFSKAKSKSARRVSGSSAVQGSATVFLQRQELHRDRSVLGDDNQGAGLIPAPRS